MSCNLDSFCAELISNIKKESDFITTKIDIDYKENKDKWLIIEKYQLQIDEFLYKYSHSLAGIINTNTNELLGIDKKCTEKIKEVTTRLKSYITDLEE